MTRTDLAAALCAALATPVVTWWAVGDLGSPGGTHYVVRALGVPRAVSLAITISATAALVLSLVMLVRASRTGRMGVRGWLSLACAMAVGVLVGLTARVLTAATIDANIGAGVALIGCVLLGVPLLAASFRLAVRVPAARQGPR